MNVINFRGYSDYRRAGKFCSYCKWQLIKYKSWNKEYDDLYDNELALAPLTYLEYLEDDAPTTMPRRESDLWRLRKYFSRGTADAENESDDPDEDNQPWERGPTTALQQVNICHRVYVCRVSVYTSMHTHPYVHTHT